MDERTSREVDRLRGTAHGLAIAARMLLEEAEGTCNQDAPAKILCRLAKEIQTKAEHCLRESIVFTNDKGEAT